MKIAFLYNSDRFIGGGEIGFTELIEQAAPAGVEGLVLVPGPGEITAALDQRGIAYQFQPLPSLRHGGIARLPLVAWRLGRLARRNGCDLIHANGARAMLYAGLAGRLTGVPVLWHVRVLERDGMLDHARAWFASTIVCNSGAVAATVRPFATAAGKTLVIYNGVDQARFTAAEPLDLHHEFGIPPERRVAVVVALLVEWKGQREVVQALAAMSTEARRGVSVVFVGRELTPGQPFTAELKQLASAAGVSGHIVWAGQRDDVPRIMRGADLLVLSSRGEPFGRVIVEAWAAGLPVLATETGGAGEIIEHGRTGWLIPERSVPALAQALPELLADTERRAGLAANGRVRAQDFTLTRHATSIFAHYRKTIALKRSSGPSSS